MGFWLRDAADGVRPPLPAPATRSALTASYGAPRTITASAERITIQNAAYAGRVQLEWQRAAWVAYERVGEIHFGFNLLAGLLSRVRFYGAAKGSANEPPTDVEAEGRKPGVSRALETAVRQAVDELFAVDGPGMIRNFVLNICVPGESLLVELPATTVTPSRWAIRSTSELQVRGDGSAVLTSRRDGAQQVNLPPGTYMARIWRRHPQHSNEADSSMLGVADAVEELLMLQRLVRGATRSRLNAGVLFVPDGVASAINPKRTAEPPVDETADPFDALRAASVEDPSGKFLADLVETMTKPINDESSAATVVPMLVTGPGDEGQKIRHITFERPTDAWLTDRIEKVLDRILQGIDMPKEIITGMQQVKYCMDSNTQALTRAGWKHYTDLAVGDDIYTLNPDTHLGEWQPVEAVNTFPCVDEPVLSLEQRGHSSLSTMDHRWLVRRGTTREHRRVYDQAVVTSREMGTGHFIPIAAPSAELPVEAKYSDAFVELIAWYWTEGFITGLSAERDTCVDRVAFKQVVDAARRRQGLTWARLGHMVGTYANDNSANVALRSLLRIGGGRPAVRDRLAAALELDPAVLHELFTPTDARQNIVLTQSMRANPAHVARIRACLTALYGPASPHPRGGGRAAWSESVTSGGCVQFRLNDEITRPIQNVCVGQDKVTDLRFIQHLTRAQLELFIETAINGDGWRRTGGGPVIHQKVAARLDAMEMACILSGRGVHRYSYLTRSGCTQHTLVIKQRTWVQPVRSHKPRVETTYTGTVWCPTVANHTWFAKRNGTVFCTANSNAVVIDEGMYKANIEPLALTAADAFTAVYLRPRLKAMGFSDDDIAKVVIWYDPSEIVTRPNSADEATEGLDRGVLSATAWRREHGYAESDAPAEEERAAQLLSKVSILPEQVVIELLRQSYPKVFADLPDPEPKPIGVGQPGGPNVVPFPQGGNQPAQPPADPQRTAIQQVGVD